MSMVSTQERRPSGSSALVHSPGSPGTSGGTGAAALTAKDFLFAIRRHIIMIVILAMLGLVMGGGLSWALLRWDPQYTATAYLLVSPSRQTIIGNSRGVAKEDIDRRIATIAHTVKTDKVYQQAIDRFGIRRTDWFNDVTNQGLSPVEELKEEVEVISSRNTNIIEVSMTGRNPEDVAAIVDGVIQAAEEDIRTDYGTDRSEVIGELQSEMATLKSLYEASSKQIDELHRTGAAGETVEAIETLMGRSRILMSQMATVEVEWIESNKMVQMMEQYTPEQWAGDPMVQQYVEMDRDIISLTSQELYQQIQIAQLQQQYGPKHRVVKRAIQTLAVLQEELARLRKTQIEEAIEIVRSQRRQMFETLNESYINLSKQIDTVDIKLKQIRAARAVLERALSDQSFSKQRIEQLKALLLDSQMLLKTAHPLTILRRPITPDENNPSFPTYPPFVAGGGFLGLLLGVGLALLLELCNSTIRGPGDIRRRLGINVLGKTPHVDDIEEEIDDMRLVATMDQDTVVHEAYRQIRTSLMFGGKDQQRRVILVTSPLPEDGRTSVTLNLAQAMIGAGNRVVVVDANFQQPALANLFSGACDDQGLGTVLQGKCSIEDALCEVKPGLTIMTAGPTPLNPTELFESDAVDTLISDLSSRFDHVLIDGGPCLVVNEPAILSTKVDGVILVVRAEESHYGTVEGTVAVLNRVGANLYGVVLNGMRTRPGGYLRKNYDLYYEYQARHMPVRQ
jgi:capsular exopolysaccharide synthesis family protein